MWSFMTCTPHQILSDQIKNNEVCRHRWEDNIKIYLQVVGFGQGGVHGWIDQAQDRVRVGRPF